jgi:hypothetical protein
LIIGRHKKTTLTSAIWRRRPFLVSEIAAVFHYRFVIANRQRLRNKCKFGSDLIELKLTEITARNNNSICPRTGREICMGRVNLHINEFLFSSTAQRKFLNLQLYLDAMF